MIGKALQAGPNTRFALVGSKLIFLGSIFIDQGPLNETRPSSSIDAEPPCFAIADPPHHPPCQTGQRVESGMDPQAATSSDHADWNFNVRCQRGALLSIVARSGLQSGLDHAQGQAAVRWSGAIVVACSTMPLPRTVTHRQPSHRSTNSGVVGPCAWYPVQAAISDVGIRDRTWRTGTRRLRTVTAAGTAGDGQLAHGQRRKASGRSRDSTVVCPVFGSSCPGFWFSI